VTDLDNADGLAVHPLRARILAETHARPFTPQTTPARVLRFAFTIDADAPNRDRDELAKLCVARGLTPPETDARHMTLDLDEAHLRWERHGEFVTLTWSFKDATRTPFEPPARDFAPVTRLMPQPGPLLSAIDLHIAPAAVAPEGVAPFFAPGQVAVSDCDDERAIAATDLRTDAAGFVRILVLDRSLSPMSAGALAQRLLEIETYRCLALLGLPEAQKLGSSLRRIETELPDIMRRMQASEGVEANRGLLDSLGALSTELEAGAAESSYRFGATRAYHELVMLRLDAIREKRAPHHPTLGSFLARRLDPAIRTCVATQQRQDDLSNKLTRATHLLRTRVDVDLESQNSDLLRRMNDRARLQLRLQQTVEGLSVAAISYYIASLAHHVLEGVEKLWHWPNPTVATAALVPVIILGVAWTVRRIRNSHSDE
jgi:uncharacterized membrane-anchored protein